MNTFDNALDWLIHNIFIVCVCVMISFGIGSTVGIAYELSLTPCESAGWVMIDGVCYID